jgi:hypothetical protein
METMSLIELQSIGRKCFLVSDKIIGLYEGTEEQIKEGIQSYITTLDDIIFFDYCIDTLQDIIASQDDKFKTDSQDLIKN